MVDSVLLKEMYDDMLDDCYPEVKVGGLMYAQSIALYRLDPIAYQVGMNDYLSSCREYYDFDVLKELPHPIYQELFEDEEEEE